jgi:hypothetical protein
MFFVKSISDHQSNSAQKSKNIRALTLGFIFSWVILDGCTLIEKTAELPMVAVSTIAHGLSGTSGTYDPVELQENLLRYAGTFINSAIDGTERLQKDGKAVGREFLVLARLRIATDTISLATGSNSLSNLVSLMIYTRSLQMSLEEYWRPKEFGDSTLPLIANMRDREKNLTEIAKTILTKDQMDDIIKTVDQWHDKHSFEDSGLGDIASVTIVNQIIQTGAQSKTSDNNAASVFALLNLDPLAGLDPATRELTETRLFGERVLFMGQYMPQLVEWQLEMLATRSTRVPEVKQVIDNSTMIASAGDRIGKAAETLPGLIQSEREKIIDALKTEQGTLTELSKQVGVTMGQGSQMAKDTDETLKAFSAILDQFRTWPTDPNNPAEPFHILDYAETASQIATMSQRVTELMHTLHSDKDSSGMNELTAQLAKQTQAITRDIVDYAIRQALLFVLISALILGVTVVATAIAYKALSRKYFPRNL